VEIDEVIAAYGSRLLKFVQGVGEDMWRLVKANAQVGDEPDLWPVLPRNWSKGAGDHPDSAGVKVRRAQPDFDGSGLDERAQVCATGFAQRQLILPTDGNHLSPS